MTAITLVDARDLERWSDSRRAQEQLPALVRRLIHATTSTASHVGLPAGDAIQQGGYDGVLIVDETHHVVPNGRSIWEFGVSSNPKGKADSDYEARKANQPHSTAGPVEPATTSFVFVTAKRWNAKTKWLKTRQAEKFWRDVRVLDADDLEAWLEQAPATHVWLSTMLGRRPAGADDLEAVWQDWAESTTPPISPDLMFAGREATRDAIRDWFTSPTAALTMGVESESPDETIALAAAALVSMKKDERIAILSRTVVVRDSEALVQISASDEPLRIVTTFSPGDLAQRATRRGHRVLIPRSPGEGVTGTLEVPRLHRDAAERELKLMGVSHDRLRELAGLARRSFLALRRRIAVSAAVSRPAWARPEVGPFVLPIFVLGAINESVPGDLEALALLAGEPEDAAVARLARLAAETDPPVRRVGAVWYLVSKEDAWDALSRYMTREVLERFVTVAVGVLGTVDPTYELASDERWAAGIYDKKRAHSGLLTRGVADTLALLGARGAGHAVGPGGSAADYAGRAVRKLFELTARDWQRWASLAPTLPSLMEAAPDATLSAIEAGLGGADPSPVFGLFGHDVDAMFSSSPHTHLLWALERAAWSADYLGRAALILAELARRDPGGSLGNRPSASLRSIFLPWVPATAASVETRLEVIDTMRLRHPDIVWDLMVAVLPKAHDQSILTGRPDWREWAPESGVRPTQRILAAHAMEIVKRMLEDAGTSGERWAKLVDALDDVPKDAHDAILVRLAALVDEPLSPTARATIWNALRELVSRHRSFDDADWALPTDCVNAIANVVDTFLPSDLIAKHRYLFSHNPALPEGREQDFQAHDDLVAERRGEAARAWYPALGAEGIIGVSATLERPDALGAVLAESGVVPKDEEPGLLRTALDHPEVLPRLFGRAYLGRRFQDGASVCAFLREHADGWSAQSRAEALLAIPAGAETWTEVEALPEEARTHYWRHLAVHSVSAVDAKSAIRELVRHGRAHAAVDLAARHMRHEQKPSAEDVQYALTEAAGLDRDATGCRCDAHGAGKLISFLENEADAGRISEEAVARLELLYLPRLQHNRRPMLLHRTMQRDPSLFIEAVCLAYRGDGETERAPDDGGGAGPLLAYQLLSSWRTPPGLENGAIDGDRLNAWVDEARKRLAENNRTAIGDQLIGQVMSGSPPGTDGAWPAEPVREVIERLRSDDVESGLHMGRFNQRGVVSRGLLSGGDSERSIKSRYEDDAAKLSAKWPRTAAFLRAFAATYEHDAMREDLEAELRHDLDL